MMMTYGVLALQDQACQETQLSELCAIIRYMVVLLPDESLITHNSTFTSRRKNCDKLVQQVKMLMTKIDREGIDKLQALLMDENPCPELIAEAVQCGKSIDQWFIKDFTCMREEAWFSALHKVPDSFYRTIQTSIHRCLEQSLSVQLKHVTENTLGLMIPCK